MNKVNQKIELTVNILIIIVAILLVGVLTQKYFFSSSSTVSSSTSLAIGNKVSLDGIDWSKSNKNVLLVLQKRCRFCSESAEFYKKLIQQTKGRNVNIIAVLPQSEAEAKEYLEGLGISGIEIKQSQSNLLQVSGTPTIIIADDKGEISNLWAGQLLPDKEVEVLNQLIS